MNAYNIYVVSRNRHGSSQPSDTIRVNVYGKNWKKSILYHAFHVLVTVFCMSAENTPSEPRNLQIELVSGPRVRLTWDEPADYANNIVLYVIFFQENGTDAVRFQEVVITYAFIIHSTHSYLSIVL